VPTSIYHCEIKADDDTVNLDIDDGLVVIMGESPSASAAISRWDDGDPEAKSPPRWRRVDRLLNCEVKTVRGTTTITGESEFIRSTIGASDFQVTLRVGPGRKCAGC
jgi:hypothetical protein